MKGILLGLSIFILGISHIHAQSESNSSAMQIEQLKNGALLVRLPTKAKVISAMRANGKEAQAKQIEARNLARNKEIVKAVNEKLSFCKSYFFYSHDSKFVMAGQLDSVQFLNLDLEHDPTIAVSEPHIFTGEIGLIEQDIEQKRENITESEAKDRDNERQAKYYGGTDMRFEAFIIKDDQFKQLKRPFPYYSRTLNSFFMKKKLSEVMFTMNKKLNKFYSK